MSEDVNGHEGRTRRVLVIDDNEATHGDFRKILVRQATVLDNLESVLFGDGRPVEEPDRFEIDSAFQGEEGLEMVRRSLAEGRPYEMAFVDLRMPPGWDGVETITRIRNVNPQLPIVLCAAYLGCTPDEMLSRLSRSERVAVLEKPFEPAEVLQLANTMIGNGRPCLQRELASA